MGKLKNFLNSRRSPEAVDNPVLHVGEEGTQAADRIINDELGSGYSLDWSFPQAVGLKGDSRFLGDSLVIVPRDKQALEIIYGGLQFVRHGSETPLGELSNRFTNEVNETGRVFLEIARRED